MKRKTVILLSIISNSLVLFVLFIWALASKEEKLVPTSVPLAGSILEKDPDGMVPPLAKLEEVKTEEFIPLIKEEERGIETKSLVLHKLPPAVTEKEIDKGNFLEVVVKKGDSLDKIAKRNHITVSEIKKINHLEDALLQIGQVLLIPKTEQAQENPEYYIVQHGDNPWTIAIKHNMNVSELLRLNNLDTTKAKRLRPGDKLRIR